MRVVHSRITQWNTIVNNLCLDDTVKDRVDAPSHAYLKNHKRFKYYKPRVSWDPGSRLCPSSEQMHAGIPLSPGQMQAEIKTPVSRYRSYDPTCVRDTANMNPSCVGIHSSTWMSETQQLRTTTIPNASRTRQPRSNFQLTQQTMGIANFENVLGGHKLILKTKTSGNNSYGRNSKALPASLRTTVI